MIIIRIKNDIEQNSNNTVNCNGKANKNKNDPCKRFKIYLNIFQMIVCNN